ncbi:phage gp6-like head-tail connector protein [Cereibacter sphaeroides]|uniref:Phage gp6-like head-tail connector protein n=1 Tax=Cereibacter sphaeroides TaxID=1063 RepID=A0AAX1UFF1_CERSP|nr:head-tail connector protein [Cereibacter sphaeroides]RHZ91147.1 phage gp6-like head-tail connector protein [Cereibacter sphaeroides]
MITDLAILKEHLRASAEIQNGLIVLYAEAVEERLTAFLDRPVYADAALIPAPGDPDHDPLAIVAPRAFHVAVMLLVGMIYDGEWTQAAPDLPGPVRSLMEPYRAWRDLPEQEEP